MDITTILTQLNGDKLDWTRTALSGGTRSEVYLLTKENDKAHVLKINKAETTQAEVDFLSTYQSISLLPDLTLVDPGFQFMVYTHIPGAIATSFNSSKNKLMQHLVSGLLNRYQPASTNEQWGWRGATVSTWEQFLTAEVEAAKEILAPCFKRAGLHIEAPVPTKREQANLQPIPYLLHGDCVFHNFLVSEEQLTGIIDPTPIFGWPHYDLIYAFFSSPYDLTKEGFDAAAAKLTVNTSNTKQLYEEVLIGLYQRLAICLKHHPADWLAYLEVWDYWTEIVDNH
ncbi:aminoglycoside phosphotransferase family protein [Planococcus sp. ANT_H30]|uniref:aminoglycoside phosphotransferase family protein n=1 Tax=Planococcus sp. ANT_H30 TaxID=2597347 RepID=UPI0011EBC8F7|nr:aminoglycoside phosphotransferase family protein [Planococcus sp. ANT_H30]KAA0957614.1 aminoglycoside phosphotransferase family protein [Planococcus sp. ANT_H30]